MGGARNAVARPCHVPRLTTRLRVRGGATYSPSAWRSTRSGLRAGTQPACRTDDLVTGHPRARAARARGRGPLAARDRSRGSLAMASRTRGRSRCNREHPGSDRPRRPQRRRPPAAHDRAGPSHGPGVTPGLPARASATPPALLVVAQRSSVMRGIERRRDLRALRVACCPPVANASGNPTHAVTGSPPPERKSSASAIAAWMATPSRSP
jgi:hypothetical protein